MAEIKKGDDVDVNVVGRGNVDDVGNGDADGNECGEKGLTDDCSTAPECCTVGLL